MSKYLDPITLRLQVDKYFADVHNYGKFTIGAVEYLEEFPTITGLSIYLGFSSSGWVERYYEDRDYERVIDYAKLRMENWYEKKAQEGNTNARIALRRLNKAWEEATTVNHGFTFADMVKKVSDNRAAEKLAMAASAGATITAPVTNRLEEVIE